MYANYYSDAENQWCVYVYVCIYVCMYVYMYVYMYVCVCLCVGVKNIHRRIHASSFLLEKQGATPAYGFPGYAN